MLVVMLKFLHARLQHYANQELTDVQAGLRKGRGTRDQIADICWIREKANYVLPGLEGCVDHNKQWKTLKEMGISDHLTCLLRNLYAGQEAIVKTLYGTTD